MEIPLVNPSSAPRRLRHLIGQWSVLPSDWWSAPSHGSFLPFPAAIHPFRAPFPALPRVFIPACNSVNGSIVVGDFPAGRSVAPVCRGGSVSRTDFVQLLFATLAEKAAHVGQ